MDEHQRCEHIEINRPQRWNHLLAFSRLHLGSEVYEDNEYADYWTSTVDTSDSNRAISFGFYPPNDVRFDEGDYRYTGLSVRPVFQVSNQSEGNTANSQP